MTSQGGNAPAAPAKGAAIKNFVIGGISGMIATTFVSNRLQKQQINTMKCVIKIFDKY